MKKFVERCNLHSPTGGTKLLAFEDIAVSVFLNKKIFCSESSITGWLESGLLVNTYEEEENIVSTFDAPCPKARSVIYACLLDVHNNLSLIADKQTKGRALELLFLKPFINATQSSPVTKTLKATDGTICNLQVERVIHQSRPHCGIYQLQKIIPGTLLICHDDHQLINFYLYSTDGSHVFIQVSHMSYSAHCGGGQYNLRLLWKDIEKQISKKRKTMDDNEDDNADENEGKEDKNENEEESEEEKELVKLITKRMKVLDESLHVRNYYRRCSGSKETKSLTNKDTIIFLTMSSERPKKLDKRILICDFVENAHQFDITAEFLINAQDEKNKEKLILEQPLKKVKKE